MLSTTLSDLIFFVCGLPISAYLVLSIRTQFKAKGKEIVSIPSLVDSFLPQWSFFAPVPGQFDFHLMMRLFVEKQPSNWKEIEVVCRPRSWSEVFWSPHRRMRKAFFDLVTSLLLIRSQSENIDACYLSTPYLSLLMFVNGQVKNQFENSQLHSVQFMIVQGCDVLKNFGTEVLFLSDIHRIDYNLV